MAGSVTALAAVGCETHSVFATGDVEEYGACGVCFDSQRAFFRAKDVTPAASSCAFMFRGQGITVEGEHSGLVPTPERKDGYHELAGGALGASGQHDGQFVQTIWMPASGGMPKLLVTVTYDDRALQKIADGVISSTRRCATGMSRVVR